MTSGPMRAGALPPDRQPDPQVVAWMRGYLRDKRQGNAPYSKATAARAWLDAHDYDSLSDSPWNLRELIGAYEAARKPLTVADIPAGQGAASLFIGPGTFGFKRSGLGDRALMCKLADGSLEVVDWPPAHQTPGGAALWEHLTATLPTIDTTEESK